MGTNGLLHRSRGYMLLRKHQVILIAVLAGIEIGRAHV